MKDMVTHIMVEVLSILGTATKEAKQGWTSEFIIFTNAPSLTEDFSERYLKRLAGRADIEGAIEKIQTS
jgi:hypothetical protein